MSDSQREFEIILWGASGFTGRLVADYLYANYGQGNELRWALAGRNQSKLEGIVEEIAGAKDALPIVIAGQWRLGGNEGDGSTDPSNLYGGWALCPIRH